MEPRLQVLISTFGSGAGAIDPAGLPRLDGVAYMVSWQNPEGLRPDLATLAARPDVSVVESASRGLSNNRNAAFDLASAPYVLIADDDLSFRPEGLQAIIQAFDSEPALDFLTLRSDMPEPRVYPADGHDLARPCKGYAPVSFEIALRRSSLVRSGVRFSPLAGIGAPYLCAGEEELFVYHLCRAGLHGRFVDAVCAVHPGSTTGFRRAADAAMLRTKGSVACRTQHPLRALLRLPLLAARAPIATPKALLWLVQGYCYALKNRRQL